MTSERPQPERAPRDPEPAIRITATPKIQVGARQRVREALTCPFCHDAVPSRGGALCARDGCGALYHRECWEECARDYGGCAVYGCGCTEARDLSPVGWLVRWLRLLTAALLFPPRVVRALQRREGLSAGQVFRQAGREGTDFLHGQVRGLPVLLGLAVCGLVLAGEWIQQADWLSQGDVGRILATTFGLPLLAIYSPFLLAFGYTALVLLGRALAGAFHSELNALRGGDGGYLSRIGRGGK